MEFALSPSESRSLKKWEGVIERGLSTFRDVGNALLEIRENKLYRNEYQTFEAYCQERWQFGKSHAYRLIEAAKTADSVPHGGQILTERHARELGQVPPEKRSAVLEWAEEKADGKPLTAKTIREAAADVLDSKPDDESDFDMFDEPEPDEPDAPADFADLETLVRKWITKHNKPLAIACAMLENLAAKLRKE